jgi:hypothetical protein
VGTQGRDGFAAGAVGAAGAGGPALNSISTWSSARRRESVALTGKNLALSVRMHAHAHVCESGCRFIHPYKEYTHTYLYVTLTLTEAR